MTDMSDTPIIAFLWRINEITAEVIQMAHQTGTRAIFDFSRIIPPGEIGLLLSKNTLIDLRDILISPSSLLDPDLQEILSDSGIKDVWVNLHPHLLDKDPRFFWDALVELSEFCGVFPIFCDIHLLMRVLEEYREIGNIVLKGCEASGFVCSETALTLYSTVLEKLGEQKEAPNLLIWGGVATPEAAASFILTGAKGIIFEGLHWLTDLVQIDGSVRQRISRLRPDHTELVGLKWQVPCRVFNKGNSAAVKSLREMGAEENERSSGSQCASFMEKIRNGAVPALESRFSPDELIPLGIDAAFASSFAARFGPRTKEAVEGFLGEIESLCDREVQLKKRLNRSRMAHEMGIRFPIIQGAMTWISDVPEFALAVARAGALPTVALGSMDGETLEQEFGDLREKMGEYPYAVNVVALAENPFLEDQVVWIKRHRPPFAVIAAGDPSYAHELKKHGIEVLYIAPSEELIRLALNAGIRYVICEGNEAGGHVGLHSTLTLAQLVLELRRAEPVLFVDKRIIFAGGIFNKETALMAAMLGADAVQVGTAYLATKEIVDTCALTPLYQRMILDASPGATVVSGEGTGLRVRSLDSPKMKEICLLEQTYPGGGEDETLLRKRIEELSSGSLLIAAKGVDRPRGESLSEEMCLKDGQFMSGACAGAIHEVRTLEDLHLELAEGFLGVASPYRLSGSTSSQQPQQKRDFGRSPHRVAATRGWERVGITGMSVFNALGNSLQSVWEAVVSMRSGIVNVPPWRWDHTLYHTPRPRTPEKTYCRVGAFTNVNVSRKDLGIPPHDFRTMTASTRLTLWLAQQALEDSGILQSNVPRERVAVLISQNSGEAAGTLSDLLIRGSIPHILASIKRAMPISKEQEASIEREIKSGRMAPDDTTLMGRLNCAAGGFLCQKYGFQGPTFSVSAACATSLVALYTAIHLIRNGTIDAALVGGAEEPLTPVHFVEFSALGVLCGIAGIERPPAEASRPFDAQRDGMVLGEGGGMLVVERESIARERGARIHAFITGVGASNSSQGMVESSRATQAMAIRTAFRESSHGPEDVDLIECHATGTPQGDLEEVHALKLFYDGDSSTAITSFKSQIGHTLGSSGLNSLIRGVLAMNAGVLPPTLNCTHPDPAMDLGTSGLWIPHAPMEWKRGTDRPRRLQVNAFGFGGSNFVIQVEQCLNGVDLRLAPLQQNGSADLVEDATAASMEGVHFFSTRIQNQPYRLAILAENEETAARRVRHIPTAGSIVHPVPKKEIERMGRQGIYLGEENSAPLALAFVFPGQGSHYAGMGRELYEILPIAREWLDRAASAADFDLRRILFQKAEEDLNKTWWQQPALFSVEFALAQSLISLGIRPAVLLGHSLGELTALCLAGVFSFEDGFRIVHIRAQCMKKAARMHRDPGVMMAVDAPLSLLEELSPHWNGVAIANVNSPCQVVLGGYRDEVEAVGRDLRGMGYRCTLLNVSMAFHSPMMGLIRNEFETSIKDIRLRPPERPVISNITGQVFPSDPSQIRKMIVSHIETPVRWMQDVLFARERYHTQFLLEVGPGEVLTHLILDTLEDVTAIPTCLHGMETRSYRAALARLFVHGNLSLSKDLPFLSLDEKNVTLPPAPEAWRPLSHIEHPTTEEDHSIEKTVQREINAFVIETYGRFLKPGLLRAIQREHDASFNQTRLEGLLATMFPRWIEQSGDDDSSGQQRPPTDAASQEGPDFSSFQGNSKFDSSPVRAGSGQEDVIERIIQIIMDATGYEREEIHADLNLRDDLAIRSSRLPVIVDAVERQFGIVVQLQDFIHVRTVRDVAIAVQEIMARTPDEKAGPGRSLSKGEKDIRRVVFSEVPLQEGGSPPVLLEPHETVLILSPDNRPHLLKPVTGLCSEYEIEAAYLPYLKGRFALTPKAFDLRSTKGVTKALHLVRGFKSLSGMVVDVSGLTEDRIVSMADLSRLLSGVFSVTKAFLESPFKKFICLLLHGDHEGGRSRLLFEGLQGLMLSAAHEYPSLALRSAILSADTGLDVPLRDMIEGKYPVMEVRYRSGKAFALAGSERPIVLSDERPMILGEDRVVVISGGGRGIASHLAHALAPFGPKVILLGRSAVSVAEDFQDLLSGRHNPEEAIEDLVRQRRPGIPAEELAKLVDETSKSREILQTLEKLRSAGMEASYMECDVSRSDEVEETLGKIIEQHGRIDGIIHGAGIIRDCLIRDMTQEDISRVAGVKFLGAWNLYQAASKAGLHFFISLSSAAAVQGNPGQANYAAANRMMSALLKELRNRHDRVLFKTLVLPPVQGAGMAEDPVIRQAMKKRNIAYIHVNELCELFLREIPFGKPGDVDVLYTRGLPEVKTVLLDLAQSSSDSATSRFNGSSFRNGDFPLIDSIESMDLRSGSLVAHRSFTEERDLWLQDHRPLKSIRHPLISGIMVIEAFLEAARILYPYLKVKGVRNIQFQEFIECPSGEARSCTVLCHRLSFEDRAILCEALLLAGRGSRVSNSTNGMTTHCDAQILLGHGVGTSMRVPAGFPVRMEEMDTPAVGSDEMLRYYGAHSELKERYRVTGELDGTGPNGIRGFIVYHEGKDFSHREHAQYQYSPYLLEAMFHLAFLHAHIREQDQERAAIPVAIDHMWFDRKCLEGEKVQVHGRLNTRDPLGTTWDIMAFDLSDTALMAVQGLRMQWL